MPLPDPFPCGGPNQKPCPPTNAVVVNGVPHYTVEQLLAYAEEYHQWKMTLSEPQADDL